MAVAAKSLQDLHGSPKWSIRHVSGDNGKIGIYRTKTARGNSKSRVLGDHLNCPSAIGLGLLKLPSGAAG